MAPLVDYPFSLYGGPGIDATCGACPAAATFEYQSPCETATFCGNCACRTLHGNRPPTPGPLWCPGCDSWTGAP